MRLVLIFLLITKFSTNVNAGEMNNDIHVRACVMQCSGDTLNVAVFIANSSGTLKVITNPIVSFSIEKGEKRSNIGRAAGSSSGEDTSYSLKNGLIIGKQEKLAFEGASEFCRPDDNTEKNHKSIKISADIKIIEEANAVKSDGSVYRRKVFSCLDGI
jgi:hypothetical protein